MLSKTQSFYEKIRMKLDKDLGGIYKRLTFHFKDRYGAEKNFYQESIEKNIAYLTKITKESEEMHLAMLKRGGIVEKSETILAKKNHT
ncbi:MAG: hypothetical protein WA632_03185 [Gallionella sp.]